MVNNHVVSNKKCIDIIEKTPIKMYRLYRKMTINGHFFYIIYTFMFGLWSFFLSNLANIVFVLNSINSYEEVVVQCEFLEWMFPDHWVTEDACSKCDWKTSEHT